MMSGLAWLNDLMVWLARWVPRLAMIKFGYQGVMFGRNGAVSLRNPGLCFYWPITNELTVVSTRVRTSELAAQLHGTEAISVVVLYRIDDPVAMLTHTHDVFSMLDDRTQAHLAEVYASGGDNQKMCGCIEVRLRQDMEPYGVSIDAVNVAQRGFVLPVKLLQDYAQHAMPQLGDEKMSEQGKE